jgi:hypothetical protein
VRRTATLVLAAATLATSLAPPTAAVAAARKVLRVYEGTTSDGGSILLLTSVRDGVVRFQGLGLATDATCEDGSSVPVENGLDFSPRGLAMDAPVLDIDRTFFSDAFAVSGSLGTRRGTGTVRYVVATLDASEEAQTCTTGELTWTAARVTTVGPTPANDHGTVLVQDLGSVARTVALEPAGDLASLLSRSAGATTRSGRAPRLRSYEGRMSSGDPFFVVTERRPEGVVMHELGLAWELACDDGTSFGLGFFIFFAGEPLEPGRLDHDIAAPMLGLHIHGTLDAHLGEGTQSTVVPALTADLDAMGCRTGDLTWRAWRTDEGF